MMINPKIPGNNKFHAGKRLHRFFLTLFGLLLLLAGLVPPRDALCILLGILALSARELV